MQARLIVKRLPIRVKLTVAFSGAVALMLAGVGTFLYFHFKAGLDAGINQALRARAGDLAALVREGPAPLSASHPLAEHGESFAQILNGRGRVLETSRRLGDRPLLTANEIRSARAGPIMVERGEKSRLLAEPVRSPHAAIVVVGASLDEREKALEILSGALLIGGPLALLLASGAGYALASGALAPVESMGRRAASISEANAEARLPLPEARDEIHRLGMRLNAMLERLQQSLEHERRFVSDASHELRTPLTILKAEIDVALRGDTSKSDLRSTLGSAREETDRLARLADDLLLIARTDEAHLPLRTVRIRADEMLRAVADRFALRGRELGRRIVVVASEGLSVTADPVQVEQALGNLLDNALRYGAGDVSLSTKAADGFVELHVIDAGGGFPEAFLPRAFDRFSRADRSGAGAGLGLAIVAGIARGHAGEAHAANLGPPGGADVWLSLPGTAS
jgi:two-component system OmpR family sensor kinase